MEDNLYHNTRANLFDALVGEVELEVVLQEAVGTSVLDVGCGIGLFTKELCRRFKDVTGLDSSETNIALARNECPTATFCLGNAESIKLNKTFDSILMMNILEHVDSPIEVIENMKKHLDINGKIIIHVPNGGSLNRQLGLLCGITKTLLQLSEEEIALYGHKRVYDLQGLVNDITTAGLVVSHWEGVVFKPFTNAQMLSICEPHGLEWSKTFVRALQTIGKRYPDMCATLHVVAELPK